MMRPGRKAVGEPHIVVRLSSHSVALALSVKENCDETDVEQQLSLHCRSARAAGTLSSAGDERWRCLCS